MKHGDGQGCSIEFCALHIGSLWGSPMILKLLQTILVGIFKSGGVLPTLELDTCTKLTIPWPRRSIITFFRDLLYPLVCIFVEKDSCCSRIMTPNTPQKICKNYLKTKEDQGALTVRDFPTQSPDLNPTEHLWGHLKTEKVKHSVTSQEALWTIVRSCWDNVGHQVLHKTMPAQVLAVIKAKVGHTKH